MAANLTPSTRPDEMRDADLSIFRYQAFDYPALNLVLPKRKPVQGWLVACRR